VTPTLSVEAVQDKATADAEVAEAVRLAGVEGADVSAAGGTKLTPVKANSLSESVLDCFRYGE